ncbi:MAG: methyltransferase [Acidobacteria bacterium]|nr:methyltransferase [Acidobacteriota bacterium]
MERNDRPATVAANEADVLSPVKQALVEIRRLRSELEESRRGQSGPVSILGVAVRLPGGVASPERFWQALASGEDLISTVPPERWESRAYWSDDPDEAGKMYDVHGGFIDDVDAFDAEFFGINAREAESMDPQQRLLLELTWEALERSGIDPRSLMNTQTGVYIGMTNSDYGRRLTSDVRKIDGYTGVGAAASIAAGRIAYFLGTHGPGVAFDTACSSSLVAVHQAVQGLRRGEIDLAIVGGVNLILTPEMNVGFSRTRMLARDGRCKTFDAAADGYVRAEGCCVIVLKRETDARRDGNHVLANILGAAVNQDGRSAGITAPNGPAQEMVMQAALSDAGLSPAAVSYIEAHGTGTPLGDPMEVQAIGAVYAAERDAASPLHIGSVKTNLGHTEAAAGLTGLIKVVLMMQPGRSIAPHLNCQNPSSQIDWQRWRIRIPVEATRWPSEEETHFAGVSSFGFSGTNAHVILGSVKEQVDRRRGSADAPSLLCLSAANDAGLCELAERYIAYLRSTEDDYAEICAAVAVGRARLGSRLAVLAQNAASAAQLLEGWFAGEQLEQVAANVPGGSVPASFPIAGVEFVEHGSLVPSILGNNPAVCADLPTYPFQRRRFWFGLRPVDERRQQRDAAWEMACMEAERQSLLGPLGWDVEHYPERWVALEGLTLAHARNLFVASGALSSVQPANLDEVMQCGGFLPIYRKIVSRWLEGLERLGSIVRQGDSFQAREGFSVVALDAYWTEAERWLSKDDGILVYLRHCGSLLDDVLRGRTSALETLFPDGSFALAENLYENNVEARYLNPIVGCALRSAARELGQRRTVRILEIGGGTGGTTAAVLTMLQRENVEYLFTDVSDLFLNRARRKFSEYPFLRFDLFDIDRDAEEQGFPLEGFDLILAANVIHAAQDLGAALERVHRLLVPGGMLVLLETTRHHAWFDMSTGLIEGWQHFTDSERGDNPLLPVERWQSLLERNGFSTMSAFPSADSKASQMGQHVLLARRDEDARPVSLENLSGRTRGRLQAQEAALVSAVAIDLTNLDADERALAISTAVRQAVCDVFRLEGKPDTLGDRDRLSDLGMDSLIALELRSELAKRLGLQGRIPSTIGFDTGTVGELSRALAGMFTSSLADAEKNVAMMSSCSTVDGTEYLTAEQVMELSEEEVERLLKERLSRL